ncbi:unnamed protein product [Mytilus edulis]|uniref:Uncharacterized protein n=1 Tax=Mytilus edulis TaxID=6550 RepID=A0A8S3TKZ1_MYTED|nr:unnamed protein product [Mytilus edulis]
MMTLDILLTTTTQDIPIASNDDSLDILLATTTQDIQIASNDDSLDILLAPTTQDVPIANIPIASNDDSLDISLATTTQDNNVATQDKTQHKLDKIISLLQKNQEPRPSVDFVSAFLQEANPDDIVIVQSSEAEEQNQPTITQCYPPVNDQKPPTVLDELTFNIDTPDKPNKPNNQPSFNNLTSTIPTS